MNPLRHSRPLTELAECQGWTGRDGRGGRWARNAPQGRGITCRLSAPRAAEAAGRATGRRESPRGGMGVYNPVLINLSMWLRVYRVDDVMKQEGENLGHIYLHILLTREQLRCARMDVLRNSLVSVLWLAHRRRNILRSVEGAGSAVSWPSGS